MSGFPPPPNQRFQAPPPPGSAPGRFPPPPAPPGGGGGGFAPPPPAPGAGFAAGGPPPPPGAPGGMHQMNNAMGNMSLQGRRPPQGFGGPSGGAPPAPTMFTPPPAPGQPGMAPVRMFQPPPPGGGGAPPPPGGAATFQAPPAPPGSAPGGPTVFQPPPPGQGPPAPMGAPGQAAQPASSNFYQGGTPLAPLQPGPSQVAPGAVPGMQNAAPIVNENIDFDIQIPDRFFRLAAGMLPQTAAQASSSKIPFGAILRPLAPDGPEDDEVDTVQPGQAGIIRCKRCRTYMNPFVSWLEHGRRWRCNICNQMNDTPSAYFCHLDEQGMRRDRFDRPELSKAAVEFIAPAEYMVRPPQEPTYFFVIDVSATAVRSGMLHNTANAIKQSLDDLPGRGRTKVGFITFDNCVHYYNLDSGLSNPQMLVVSDLKELFVPLPENLLVNLSESRDVVESLLNSLPEMFAKNPVDGQSCLGPALKAAFTVVKSVGGKMCVFQSIQPNLGDGSLKPREQPGIMGTPKEVTLLKADASSSWYKDTAIEFSRVQISVDLFLFPYQYMDLAALGDLAKYTSGSMHSYVMFNSRKDGERFEQQLNKTLTQTTGFEAVMRIRCTKGMRITNFYGNFYIRGTDLMALPNCNTDSVFAFDLAHDEQSVPISHVTIQAALLYTSSDGQRRIRVMTQALPVTSLISEVIASVDTDTCTSLLAKQAIEVTMKSGLDNARLRLQQVCVEIIRAAKGGDKRTVSGYSVPPPAGQMVGGESEEKPIPDNLKLLPLYTLALMKNVAFRGGTDVHPDERVQSYHLLNHMWVSRSKHYIYPRMFSIHEMGSDAGHPSNDANWNGAKDRVAGRNRIMLPPIVNLSVDQLTSNGIYLLDNGVDMFLWVGRSADIGQVGSLFGVQSLDDIEPDQIQVQTTGDELASRFGSIVSALNEDESDSIVINRKINVIREGSPAEVRFYWFLVEDRASFQGGTYSYAEFMGFVNNPSASAGSGAPRAPPGPGGPPHRGPPAPQRGGPPPPHAPGGPPPPHMSGGPPPPQQGMGMQPPRMGGPPPQHSGGPMGGPPPPGAPPPNTRGPPPPPRSAPPAVQGYGAPPPQPAGPPSGNGYGYGMAPPPPGPPKAGPPPPGRAVQSGPPPPQQRMPPPPAYGNPPHTNPQQPQRGMPPPPRAPPGGMPAPPPPPPGQYGR